MKKVIFTIAICTLFLSLIFSQHATHDSHVEEAYIEEIKLNQDEYLVNLKSAFESKNNQIEIDVKLPISKNQYQNFKATPRYILHPKLQAEYPDLLTFKLFSETDSKLRGRLTISPVGVFAYIDGAAGLVGIFPDLDKNDNSHYIEKGIVRNQGKIQASSCSSIDHEEEYVDIIDSHAKGPTGQSGSMLKTYRFAAVTTAEFYERNGASFPSAVAVVTSSIQGIETIYEKDFAVNFSILPPKINTDPFLDGLDAGGNRTGDAQAAVEANWPNPNQYDIGHALHSGGGGGVARLGAVCQDGAKASGWSGSGNNTSNGWIQLFAHEVGHMFSAPHTFNGIGGSCTGNISSTTSYEIASGTTIMSYQGICQGDNNIPASGKADNYFHANSIDRITGWINRDQDCAMETDLGNTPPQVDANSCGTTFIIPRQTPFRMIGLADDTEDLTLSYSWEQYDEDGPGTSTQGAIGVAAGNRNNCPTFRSYPPVSSKTRVFPKMSDVINKVNNPFEVLSNVGRLMTFRFIARDNHRNGGGIAWDQVVVEVGRNGPMSVNFPNGNETVSVGVTQPFSWNLLGTEAYCDKVDVLLSLDGGNSFNIILAEDVDYDAGSVNAAIPSGVSNSQFARVMVRCVDTECVQFFDISDNDFVINSNCRAENTNICPNEALILNSGDPMLELGLNKLVGVEESSMFVDIEDMGNSMATVRNSQVGTCFKGGNQRYESVSFRVTRPGNYAFQLDPSKEENVSTINIFEEDNFDAGDPCPSWVGGNTTDNGGGGGFSLSYNLDIELDACTNYVLTFHKNDAIDTVGIISSISGPGSAILAPTGSAPANLAYTYLAVHIETDTVVLVRNDSDFKILEPGTYKIVGVSYSTSGPLMANPNAWIGLTISELFQTGECISISNNGLPLEVLSSCAADSIQVMTQYPCNSLTNKYDQDLILYLDRSPTSGSVIVNGQPFPIIPDPDGMSPFELLITLTDLESDGESVDVFVEFSEDETCFRLFPNVFDAPNNCCEFLIGLPDTIEVCEGTEVILDASMANGEGYVWYVNGSIVPNYIEETIEAPETGFYVVSVTNAFGCSKTDTAFVIQRKYPNLKFLNTEFDICDGQSINLILQNNVRDSTFWYQDGVLIDEDVSSKAVFDASEWVVHGINDIGCETRDTIQTSIIPGVPEPFAIDAIQLCEGQDTLLLAGTDPTYIYDWSVNITNVGTIPLFVDSPVQGLIVSGDGQYLVTVTATNGCEVYDQINVNFNTLPLLTQLLPDATEFCEGEDNDILIVGNPFVYYWTKDGIPFDTSTAEIYTVTTGGLYTVHGINGFDCLSDTLEIDLISHPVPMLSGVDFYNPCENDPIILTVEADGNYQYKWTFNGMELQGETNSTLDASLLGTGDYVATAITDKNCTTDFEIIVEVILAPYNTLLNAPPKICLGEEITLAVNSNMPFMKWLHEGVEIVDPDANQAAQNFFLNVTYGGNFTALAVNNEGCEIPVEITVIEDAAPIIDAGPDIVACDATGLSIVLETDEDPGTPYAYTWWKDGNFVFPPFIQNMTVVEDLSSGEYVVRATSQNGCISWDTVQVSINAAPELNFTVDKTEICEGESATITAETNETNITWYKDGVELVGETGLTLVVTDSGLYSALLVISMNCQATQSVTITSFPQPIINVGTYNPVCFGNAILINVMPDQMGYNYEWSINGVLEPTLTGPSFEIPDDTPAGTYIYEVIASSGPCVDQGSFDIVIVDSPTINLEASAISICSGDVVDLNANASVTPLEWKKDGVIIVGETGNILSVTETGLYEVSTTTGGECDASDSVSIEVFDSPEIDGPTELSACEGQTIDINIDSNGDFLYEWRIDGVLDPGYVTKDISVSLSAGSYIFELTAIAGSCSDVQTIEVTFIETPTMVLSASTIEICTGDVLTLNANTNLNTVQWEKDGVIIQGENGITLDVTESGTYTASVSGGSNCDASDEITISVFDAPILNGTTAYSACEGETINIDLDPVGDYSYLWTVDGIAEPGLDGSIINLDLTAGDYVYEATATVGSCSTTLTIDVSVITSPTLELDIDDTDICTGDVLTVNAITNLNIVVWEKDGVIIPGQSGLSLDITEAGSYTASVSGGNNCSAADMITVNIFDAPVLDGPSTYDGCSGQDILIDALPQGNYSYEWKVDGVPEPSLSSASTTVNLSEGSYEYEVTATLGSCSVTATYTVNIISAPSISLEAPQDYICNGDMITIVATSNISDVTWLQDGMAIAGQNGVTLTITSGGTYTAMISGGNNCDAQAEIIIDGLDFPILNISAPGAVCEGGNIDIDLGPMGDYTYEWTIDGILEPSVTGSTYSNSLSAGSHTFEIMISNGECTSSEQISVEVITAPTMTLTASEMSVCVGETITLIANTNLTDVQWEKDGVVIPGQSGPSLVVDESGTYTASVSAGSNCGATDMISVEVNENPVISGENSYSSCEGSSINITVDAQGDYDYSWEVNGTIDPGLTGSNIIFSQVSGNYDLVVTAINGSCTSSMAISVEIFESAMVEIIPPTESFCEGGTLTVMANTNVSSLIWSLNGVQVPGITGPSIVIDQGGNLAVFADGGNNCVAEDVIVIEQFSNPEISVDDDNILACEGDMTSIVVNATGNYQYTWERDGNTIPGQTNILVVNQSGSYTVTATESNGCTSELSVNVSIQSPDPVVLGDDQQLCDGDSYTINASTISQNIVWYLNGSLIPGATGNQYNPTETGIYIVETTSPNGCKASDVIVINFNESPSIDIGPASQFLCEGTPFSLSVDPGFTNIQWFLDGTPINFMPTIDITQSGLYSVLVTNSGGCTAEDEMQVVINSTIDVQLGNDQNLCVGQTATLSFNAPSGSSYQWYLNGNPLTTNPNITVNESGTYGLEVTSNNGCSGSDEVVIQINPIPNSSVPDIILCPGESSSVTTSGSFSNYQWSNGSTDANAVYSNQNLTGSDLVTQQNVLITDVNGCQNIIYFNMTAYAELESQAQQTDYQICKGDTVQLNISGGDTYQWTGQGLSNNTIANPLASPAESTTYQVQISNSNCPGDIVTELIEVNLYFESNTGITTMDTCIVSGVEFTLEAFGGTRYNWEPEELIQGSNRSQTPSIIIEETTLFSLLITDGNGCTYEHEVEICSLEDPEDVLDPVTIITPNNDGMNDVLIIRGLEDFPNNELTIFNRWGNIIYETRGYQQGNNLWDGTREGEVLPADTYYYVLKFGDFVIKKPITIVKE